MASASAGTSCPGCCTAAAQPCWRAAGGATLAVLVAFVVAVVGAPLGLVSGFYRGVSQDLNVTRHDRAVAGLGLGPDHSGVQHVGNVRGNGIGYIPQEPMSTWTDGKGLLTLDATGLNAPTRTRSPGAWPRADNDRLNDIVWGLPLFPYMDVAVTPLARHAYEGSVAGRCSR